MVAIICKGILGKVGNTPLVQVELGELANINLFAKLEYYNPTGSVKDRAASYILKRLISSREINEDTTIIESSSGNFGIALAAYCKQYGLKFVCVIDPNINPLNETIIRKLSTAVIKVTEHDKNGGYLLERIKKVKEFLEQVSNTYWVNQYANPYNSDAYYHSLGDEICETIRPIDYVIMGVSSGGTITGVSQKVSKRYPDAKIIAVDTVGSIIFGGVPKKRYIPGIGSSMTPDIISAAKIAHVLMIDEISTVKACHELLEKHFIFAGGSSGSVYEAAKRYFEGKTFPIKPNVVMIFADKGDRYANTIYNHNWEIPE